MTTTTRILNASKLTTLEAVAQATVSGLRISADCEICIPGHHIEKSAEFENEWIVVNTATGKAVTGFEVA